MQKKSYPISPVLARSLWLHAQRLDIEAPFGTGPAATQRAVEHLGYVQIDTINVIERSHHHILYNRIPGYVRADLEQAQSLDKSVFEYWTHALAYVPTTDYRQFIPAMNRFRATPSRWYGAVDENDYAGLLRRIRREGALSIRDFDDDPVEKTHLWGSRKPSKSALQHGFYVGDLAISKRTGMVKSYELSNRHFGWRQRPRAATESQFTRYLLERALRAQALVSIDSICYGNAGAKAAVRALIENAALRGQLIPVHLEGNTKFQHWIEPAALETASGEPARGVHLLSPFDPLVIQRKRLQLFFDYEHRFEAYVPAAKRVLGYFALPVLVGDQIVAALDLKTDRSARRLLIQRWTWFAPPRTELKNVIEDALGRFEIFQLPSGT
jgi:uncharacterized protein YcaQ